MSVPALVVKLGGSHATHAALRPWLCAIAAAAGAVVLVPGGGPFADAVRALQPRLGFDDRTAHAMALLAMAQFAQFLIGLAPALAPADGPAAIAAALAAGRVPVWLPPPGLGAAEGIAPSWEVTSDSLALWLAGELAAPALLLVKARRGGMALLDAAFPRLRPAYAGRVLVAGPEDLPAAGLDPLHPPGTLLA